MQDVRYDIQTLAHATSPLPSCLPSPHFHKGIIPRQVVPPPLLFFRSSRLCSMHSKVQKDVKRPLRAVCFHKIGITMSCIPVPDMSFGASQRSILKILAHLSSCPYSLRGQQSISSGRTLHQQIKGARRYNTTVDYKTGNTHHWCIIYQHNIGASQRKTRTSWTH